MWLFTKFGFYSIARKKFEGSDKPIQVRARRKKDLLNLKNQLRFDEDIKYSPKSDYRYRLPVDEKELVRIMLFISENLDYQNFKRSIHNKHDQHDKINFYNQIWKVMYNYQQTQDQT